MNEKIMRLAGFGEHVDLVKQGLCPWCKQPVKAEDFRDNLSKQEFFVSGVCQKCQDEYRKPKGQT